MFDNIGGKIKVLAKVLFFLGFLGAMIGGIVVMTIDGDFIALGLLIMIVGGLLSWVSSFFIYGFGELIDKASEIADNTRGSKVETKKPSNSNQNKSVKDKGLNETKVEHKQKSEDEHKYAVRKELDALAVQYDAGEISNEDYRKLSSSVLLDFFKEEYEAGKISAEEYESKCAQIMEE